MIVKCRIIQNQIKCILFTLWERKDVVDGVNASTGDTKTTALVTIASSDDVVENIMVVDVLVVIPCSYR